MSNYIKIKDLSKSFDESDFPKDENGNNDQCRIEEAITFAESYADSFIRSAGIDTPVKYEEGVLQLRGAVLDIAWYRLQDHPSETVKARYNEAVAWFEKLAKGVVKLPQPPKDPNQLFEDEKKPKAFGLSSIRLVRG